MSTRLVSGGSNGLILWEGPDYAQRYAYTPVTKAKKAPILCSSWNRDASVIGSVVDGHDKIVYTYLKKKSVTSVELKAEVMNCPVSLQFSRTSLKHLFIASIDRIYLFDIHKQVSRKEFKPQMVGADYKLTCIATNFDDGYVAAGSNKGSIHLFNVLTGQPSSGAMNSSQVHSLTSIKYNNIRHSLLASGSESGVISLWDCNSQRRPLHSFQDHQSPSMGVAFSPVNDVLLLSAGLDKKCMCYDVHTKRTVTAIRTDQPLTAVDFSDGTTLALGTLYGNILVYDLRNLKSPTKVMAAHQGSVTSVSYQPSSLSSAVTASPLSGSKHPLAKPSTEGGAAAIATVESVKENIYLDDQRSYLRKESLDNEVFSPIRNVTDLHALDSTPDLHGTSGKLSTSKLSVDSVFSPLRESSAHSFSNIAQGLPLSTSVTTKPFLSITDWSKSAISSLNSIHEESLASRISPTPEPPAPSPPPPPPPPPTVSEQLLVSVPDIAVTMAPSEPAVEQSGDQPQESIIKAVLNAFPHVLKSSGDAFTRSPAPAPLPVPRPEPCPSSLTFQNDYLREVVEDVMSDFCQEMRKYLWHMQYDSIQLLQQHRDELDRRVEPLLLMQELRAENERLRAENQALKQRFWMSCGGDYGEAEQ